jgi:uncharacterized Zn finger protein (UPF0148 family)
MLEDSSVAIACPRCGCPTQASIRRVVIGAGVFCPACQVYISFVDDRAGMKNANRQLDDVLRSFPQRIEVRFD